MSKIEWTQKTWNPVVGCAKVSPGCKFCYAEQMHARLKAMQKAKYAKPFGLGVEPYPPHLEEPLKWKSPCIVFVNSMSDLFGLQDYQYLLKVFDVMRSTPHVYQILTKRTTQLRILAGLLDWPKNVWMGVSVENQAVDYRIQHLKAVKAGGRFLSLEPLLGPLHLDLSGIDWVIAGGESGHGARPMQLDWAREVRDQCVRSQIPFFFKQLGGAIDKRGGNKALLDGQLWHQMPEPFLNLKGENDASLSV